MANIPVINIGGTDYNVKDTEARNQITDLKSALNNIPFPYASRFANNGSVTSNGLTISYKGNGVFHISGTANRSSSENLIDTANNGLPAGFEAGQKLNYIFSFSGSDFGIEFWSDPTGTGNNWARFATDYSSSNEISELINFPSNSQGLLCRITYVNGVTYNFDFKFIVYNKSPNYSTLENYVLKAHSGGTDEPDLNNMLGNNVYLLHDGQTYSHKPDGFPNLGFLEVIFTGNWHLQRLYPFAERDYFYIRRGNNTGSSWTNWKKISSSSSSSTAELTILDLNDSSIPEGWWLLTDGHTYTNIPVGFSLGFLSQVFTGNWRLQTLYPFTGGKIYKRRGNAAGSSWESWQEVSGGGNTYNVNNEYSYPSYSQSVTLNATPTITSDSNNYLASTGDNTDRTADILAMLQSTGACHLGPGKFVVSNLQMPSGSALIGSGYSTLVRLAGTADGYAVKMNDYCSVKDLHIVGAESNPTFTDTVGGRHAILWEGNAQQSGTNPYKGMVSDIWVDNFTGGGITCYNTGYGTVNALEVVNAYITRCWAGINISYWSEFHKFTNIRCEACYISCVNNGGNNVFVNCDFSSAREIGMLLDNSQGQSPNNSHGSAVACVFNHTAHAGESNKGVGIKMLNCHSGFIFDGCQIFYSQIYLEDSDGVVVSNTNFGNNNCNVTIKNGGAVLFTGCMVEGAIPITVDNNQNVHFANCYNKFTGAEWKP